MNNWIKLENPTCLTVGQVLAIGTAETIIEKLKAKGFVAQRGWFHFDGIVNTSATLAEVEKVFGVRF